MTHDDEAWRARARATMTAATLMAAMALAGCGGSPGTVAHSLGGTVTGLMPGNQIVLTSGEDSVTLSADGRFTFAHTIGEGSAYRVALGATSPTAQPCTSTYGVGTMGSNNVANVTVICGLPGGTGSFTASGAMAVSRANHTATLLTQGHVLVSAGFNQATNTPPAERYDPANGSFVSTGYPLIQRFGHTATRLPDGQVLIAGGIEWTSGLQFMEASAELYDPVAGLWTSAEPMDTARTGHTATALPNGKVLVTGGRDTLGRSLAGAELYDPATGKWHDLPTMHDSRWDHTAVLLPNGKVLVSGGSQATLLGVHTLDSSELFDPVNESWSTTGRMARQRALHTATLLPSGKVLVAGGGGAIDGAELYDAATGSWTATAPLATGRSDHIAVLLPTGQVLVAGGQGGSGTLDSTELYNPATSQWTAGQPMLRPRYGHAATLLVNGKLLITAGSDVHDHLSSSELYH